jgi:hypothetical protein
MTRYHSAQPDPPPEALPAGTRYDYGDVNAAGHFPDGAKLKNGCYCGRVVRDDGTAAAGGHVSADKIVWRRVPMPDGAGDGEPTEAWVPKVGESCEGTGADIPCREAGTFLRFEARGETIKWRLETEAGTAVLANGAGVRIWVTRESLRRLGATAKEGHDALSRAIAEEAPRIAAAVRAKKDPYTARRLETDDAAIAAVMLKNDQRRAGKVRQLRTDLDRPINPLLRMTAGVGVMGVAGSERKRRAEGHPAAWPKKGDGKR